MGALKIVVYPCSTFFSVFSNFSALCEKEALLILEGWGTSLLAAPERAQARLDGHIQLLFKNCPGIYGKGKGAAAPWLLLLGELLELSISWLLLCILIHLLIPVAVSVASNTGTRMKVLLVN